MFWTTATIEKIDNNLCIFKGMIFGQNKELVINTSKDDFIKRWNMYTNGSFIQDAFENLTLDEREFLISGTTPKEWKEIFEKNKNP